jgi:hypothetical protein
MVAPQSSSRMGLVKSLASSQPSTSSRALSDTHSAEPLHIHAVDQVVPMC